VSEERNRLGTGTVDGLFDAWEAAWSSKQLGVFDDLVTADFHYEDPLTVEPIEGVSALAEHAERLWSSFPDARLERTGTRIADGAFAAAPCKLLGTHRAPLEGLPPTNRFVVVHCIFYCEIENVRLKRVRAFYDLYDAATQLGVLPGRGSLGEKALLMLRGFGLRAGRGLSG
jgi:steroid delta-isomerase-like uncharacterized protein